MTDTATTKNRLSTCLACGAQMADCLTRTASLRCHDCRDARAPLHAELVDASAALATILLVSDLRDAAEVIPLPVRPAIAGVGLAMPQIRAQRPARRLAA
jgi:hypothetical protein